MPHRALRIHPDDNVLVALADANPGDVLDADGTAVTLATKVPAKHKVTLADLAAGDPVVMYGLLVGRATRAIPQGSALTLANTAHAATPLDLDAAVGRPWSPPDVARFAGRTFDGYARPDGRFGTRNLWLVLPLVFCENRNVQAMQAALEAELGYARPDRHRLAVRELLRRRATGEAGDADPFDGLPAALPERPFRHVDGIRFLTHAGGCGGTREDARALCGLLAGYLVHPNVAGATVLSLGCQHAQVALLREEIARRDAAFARPLHVFEQQRLGTEDALMRAALEATLAGLADADRSRREPAPLAALSVGLECGGSDGFSGISANPAVGHASDLIAALGGTSILSEFPELLGAEQDLVERCTRPELARRFNDLMRAYDARARAVGSGFEMNPSPGNIRDGLLTDAMKSAGAARKGGTAPVTQVLDYPERAELPGLGLLCTPGNDVESTTALAAAGATAILFTTGLGTPTGNPVAPVLKLATNTPLAERMPDVIDLDCGPVLSGEATLAEMGERILDLVIETASGRYLSAAERLGQWDFIPWKRGVSL